jgi:RNAse (barnase) inhibitor barstar
MQTGDFYTAEIDGRRCPTLTAFLREIAAAFRFPDYYGQNMNALWDCITDLDWLTENNYRLIINHANAFLNEDSGKQRADILSFLNEVTHNWANVPNYAGEEAFRTKAVFEIVLL